MKTQAWGWLVAGVLAAGLNASYHDRGLEMAHHVAHRIEHNTAAVLALASGHADRFLTEARIIAAHNDGTSCPLTNALARVQAKMQGSEMNFDRMEVLADQEEAVTDQVQALSDRRQAALERMEGQRVVIENELAAQSARLRVALVGLTPADVRVMRTGQCPRIHLNVQRMPVVNIPAPAIHIPGMSAGPV
ncbi:MAG TPA: hypothetical protein VKV39_17565 [Candidatus Sulfotelmatobacter sp.]|nr:hypothetical protein [Candidatus Sulfotelmatobacter sp.]